MRDQHDVAPALIHMGHDVTGGAPWCQTDLCTYHANADYWVRVWEKHLRHENDMLYNHIRPQTAHADQMCYQLTATAQLKIQRG